MRRAELVLVVAVSIACLVLGAGARHLTRSSSGPPVKPGTARVTPLHLTGVTLTARVTPLGIPSYPRKRVTTKAPAGDTASGSGTATATQSNGTQTASATTVQSAAGTGSGTASKTTSKKASTTPKTQTHQSAADPPDEDGGGTLGG